MESCPLAAGSKNFSEHEYLLATQSEQKTIATNRAWERLNPWKFSRLLYRFFLSEVIL
jgi:hypothetical protein